MRGLAGLDGLLDQGQHLRRENAPYPPAVLHKMFADAFDTHLPTPDLPASGRAAAAETAAPAGKAATVARTAATPGPGSTAAADKAAASATTAGDETVGEHREEEGNDRRDSTQRQRPDQKPRHHADNATGGHRTEQPSQQSARKAADNDGHEEQNGKQIFEMSGFAKALRRLRRGQRLAVDHRDHPPDTVRNATGKIPAPKFRRDDLADDPAGGGVGETALQPVSDLDAQLAIILGHHQEDQKSTR